MNNKRAAAVNLIFSALGILIIVMMVRFSGVTLRMIIDSIVNTKAIYLFAVFTTTFLAVFITSRKWEIILRDLAEIKNVERGYFFYYSALGLISNYLVPHIGNYGIKSASMRMMHNVPLARGALSILIEQLFDLMVITAFIIPSLLFFINILSLYAAIALIGALLILLFGLLLYDHTLTFRFFIKVYNFICKIIRRAPAPNSNHELFSKKTALKLFGYSCLRQACSIIRFYALILAMQINISFLQTVFVSSMIQAMILAVVAPASLGILEAGWFAMLTVLGINRTEIGVFVVVTRILLETSLISTFFIGQFYYLSNKMLFRKKGT